MKTRLPCSLLILLVICFSNLNAQITSATSQQTGATGSPCAACVVTDPANAADGDLQSFSRLTVTVGLNAQTFQELIFGTPVAANTAVSVKLGTGDDLLSMALLGAVFIQPYNGVTPAGPAVSGASLMTALNSDNQVLIGLQPALTYDRIRVTLDGGTIGVISTIYLYEAFYMGGNDMPCNAAFDELHGVSAGLLNLGPGVGGVENPELAIDGDLTTASTLNAGIAAVGGYTQQTALFSKMSAHGDSVRVTFSVPQTLLEAGLLSSIEVSTFRGNVSNNDTRAANASSAGFRTVEVENDRQKAIVAFMPEDSFDRIQVRLGGGIANTLSTIDIYEIQRVISGPVITYDGDTIMDSLVLCSGTAASLIVAEDSNMTYNWYTQDSGGVAIATGTDFTTPPLTADTAFYVEGVRDGCADATVRTAVNIKIVPIPEQPLVSDSIRSICEGQETVLIAQPASNITVNWFADASGGSPLFSGDTFTIPAVTDTFDFYAEAAASAYCVSNGRKQVTIYPRPLPAIPTVAAPVIAVNSGQTATLRVTTPEAGATYNWYDTITAGTVLYTGISFTTPVITASTTYYVEAVFDSCASTARASVTITVNPVPDIIVTPPVRNINAGQTTSFTASSGLSGVIFNWYTSAAAATPVFTGSVFNTPQLYAGTVFYAEAMDTSTGSTSPRATATVTINNAPDITVTPPVRNINAGDSTTFTASSTASGVIFYWYTLPAGGMPVYAGPVFRTPAVYSDTVFYAEAVDTVTNAISARATATITINDAPDIMVTPPVRNINPGTTTTFTASSSVSAAIFSWYDRPSGGTALYTGSVFTTPSLSSNTIFYAEAEDPSTGAISARATATVRINGIPDIVVIPPVRHINAGETASFTASSSMPAVTFNWYTQASGGTSVYTGAVFTTPAMFTNTTYYTEAVDPITGATSGRASASVVINGLPDITIIPLVRSIYRGAATSFTASSTTVAATFRWYASPSGGAVIFTGATFITPPLDSDTVFYAEAVSPSGAISARASATVIINEGPDITVTPPVRTIGAGQITSFTASSTTPNATFRWYNEAGILLFTGAVFTTPPISVRTTFYAEAMDPATGALSRRAPGVVEVGSQNAVVFVPNSFSPNRDGNNDELKVFGATLSNYDFKIYNQWGQVLFESRDQSKGWDGSYDGKNQPVGVYVYFLEGKVGDSEEEIQKQGTVLLIR